MSFFQIALCSFAVLVIAACGGSGSSSGNGSPPHQGDPAGHDHGSPSGNAPSTSGPHADPKPLPPNQLTVHAKFHESPGTTAVTDEKGLTHVILGANVSDTVYSVDSIHDFISLSKASSHTFVSPQLGACQLTDYYFEVLGPANEILNLAGVDAKGSTACADFLKAIGASGLRMTFTDVPLVNSPSTVIKTVDVIIDNP